VTIGQRIQQKRKEMRLSADELAKRLGKDRSTIYRYEKGDIEKFPLDILEPIAKALNTTPAYLMGWENKEKENNIIADIVVRLRTDSDFLSVVETLYSIDEEKLRSVKQMLLAFNK
jgi:transcriptional regulator with XRE-family HTH domain